MISVVVKEFATVAAARSTSDTFVQSENSEFRYGVAALYLTGIDVVKAPFAFISILETLSGLTPKPSILSVLLGTVVKINVVPTRFRTMSYFLP